MPSANGQISRITFEPAFKVGGDEDEQEAWNEMKSENKYELAPTNDWH